MHGHKTSTTGPRDHAAPRYPGHHGAGLTAPGSAVGLESCNCGDPPASRAQCAQQ